MYGPPGALGLAIVEAAFSAQSDLAPVLGFSMTGTASQPQILVFCELLYFYAHLTVRSAVTSGFSEDHVRGLQGFLGPLLVSTAVNTFFRDWPDKLKDGLWNDVYEKLNDAELEYAECRGLVSAVEPLSTTTLIGRLASNVAALWERPTDSTLKAAVASASVRAFQNMGLETLLNDTALVIHLVDPSKLREFWQQGA